MNADILFSAGVTVASIAAVGGAVYLFPGRRGMPRTRLEVLVKILSAGCSGRADKARDDWGYRLHSFGDLVYAFSDAMNREGQSHAQSTSRRGCYKRGRCNGAGASLTSSQVR